MIASADTKQGNITIYRHFCNERQYFIMLNNDYIAQGMTYEAAARLFNSYVSDEDAIPLW